jgi:chemosensory pili system protein ChpA (sensor histidine kinase/response regulator)
MRDAGNLKRVSLPGTESALPTASPDTGGLRSARARKPQTVIFPLSSDPPAGGEPGAPDAWLPADQEADALNPWLRSDEDAAFPERAEQIPWPSEAEMLAEWSQPRADPGQSDLPGARSWVAVPFSPVSPRGEAAAPDAHRAEQGQTSDARADLSDPRPLPDLPGGFTDDAVAPFADVRLTELPRLAGEFPPTLAGAWEEPADYFPAKPAGDTTLRLAADHLQTGPDTVRLDAPLPQWTDQAGILAPPTLSPLTVSEASAGGHPAPLDDSLLDKERASPAPPMDLSARPPQFSEPPAVVDALPNLAVESKSDPIKDADTNDPPPSAGRAGGGSFGGLAEQLLEVFKEEAVEMLDLLHSSLETLERGPSAAALIEARRTVHTMKGSARMCGLPAITELAHGCEDLIGQPSSGQDSLAPAFVALLFEAETALRVSITGAADGPGSEENLRALTTRLRGARLRPPAPPAPAPPPARGAEPTPVRLNQRPALLRRPAVASVAPNNNRLAVDINKVENVVAKATEIIANRATSHALVESLSATVGELTHNVQRLQLIAMNLQYQIASQGLDNTVEQDPDGLALETYGPIKQLMLQFQEAVADQQALVQVAQDSVTNKRALTTLETHLDADLQASLMSMRMLPLSQIRVRLDQVVRSAAASAEREVRWTMEGQDVALDKQVCDRLFEPLMHLLRNAVGHGIESPEEREAQGKPRKGAIVVSAVVEGNQVVLTVSDDGRGIDPARVTAKAIAKGLITAEQGAAMSPREQMELVFRPGFSTADQVTELSGRGMGMEIVRESCIRMGGAITIGGRSQGGTVITLTVPLTLSIVHTLLVRDAGRILAIPASQVASVHLVNPDSIAGHGFGQAVRIGQAQVPLYSLPGSAASRPKPGENQERSVLLIPYRGKYAALLVDELMNEEDAIVKPLPLLLQGVDRLLGAIVLPDGMPAPVINLPPLLNSIAGADDIAPAPAAPASTEQVVLVVDDSLTMRKALSQSLSHGGFTVITARDGQEALEIIRNRGLPELITLDIEMPSMDGLEALFAIRNMAGGESVPIFMITSRTGRQHQRTAMQMGATRYFTKPYRDSEFMSAVQQATAKVLRSTG